MAVAIYSGYISQAATLARATQWLHMASRMSATKG